MGLFGHTHKWGPWEVVKDAQGTPVVHKVYAGKKEVEGALPIEIYHNQERECLTCGFLQRSKLYQ